MLEARGLSKSYPGVPRPVEAVADVSLCVGPGEFVAVLGRSGSGKSTLLGMLGGQCRPTGGQVLLDGTDLRRLSADALAEFRRRRVGFVFQFPSLLPSLRAVDNVALPALLGGAVDLSTAYQRAGQLLEQVGLADRHDAYPGELSGGQQRKVALARALVNEPALILADEPTGDLDEASERKVFGLLLDLHKRHGAALVIVTHSPYLAGGADRVVRMENGRLVAKGSSTEFRVLRTEHSAVGTEYSVLGTQHPAGQAPAPIPRPLSRVSPALPGSGVRPFLTSFASWAAVVVLAVLALNFGAAFFQRRAIEGRRAELHALEQAAMQHVRAEIQNLEYGPDGTYLLTLAFQNLDPDLELYALAPSVRVFVQVDRSWEEVEARPADSQAGQVVTLAGRRTFAFTFKPAVRRFEEQLAGYLHVRVAGVTLVSRDREPKGDLFERPDDFYVYLKPHGADDADIMRRNRWSTKPPLWIPMPPH